MIGMKMTTTGMLLRNALTAMATTRIANSDTIMLPPPPTPNNRFAPLSRTPVRTMPWPMTKSANTVINAGLAKP